MGSPFLQIVVNPDGTVTRPPNPLSPPSSDGPVLSKDVPLNPSNATYLRIYLPQEKNDEEEEKTRLLPIIVFFHGGGFVLFNAASTPYHVFCENMALAVNAVVVSVDYRLTPEHRLPAAYDDAVDAVRWLARQARGGQEEGRVGEEFLRRADFRRCFLMGGSSGANIVYQLGLRLDDADEKKGEDWGALEVAGQVYQQPYFGGAERTKSELAMEDDPILPLRATDLMWGLSLPLGANRDHEFCNPASEKKTTTEGRRCLVRGTVGDPLIDRQRMFAELLRERGNRVTARLDLQGYHAVELFEPKTVQDVFDNVGSFILTD